MKWNELSMRDKSEAMRIAVSHGVYDLDDVRNKFDEGGPLVVNDLYPEYKTAETYVSQDNKSDIEREASRQRFEREKLREQRNNVLYNNQHVWRIDPTRRNVNKDQVENEYEHNKNIARSIFDAAGGEVIFNKLAKGISRIKKGDKILHSINGRRGNTRTSGLSREEIIDETNRAKDNLSKYLRSRDAKEARRRGVLYAEQHSLKTGIDPTIDGVNDLKKLNDTRFVYDPETKVSASYNPKTNTITHNEADVMLRRNVYHEVDHAGKIGMSGQTQHLSRSIMKPRDEAILALKESGVSDAERYFKYIITYGETPIHIRDIGRQIGIIQGTKYPGREALINSLNKIKNKRLSLFDLSTEENAKKFWDIAAGNILATSPFVFDGLNNKQDDRMQ
jgi:hypothetical protein